MNTSSSTFCRGLVVLALCVLAGCGVQLQSSAHTTPAEDVPYDLLSPTTSTLRSADQDAETSVCLHLGESLIVLNRSIAGELPLDSPLALLQAAPTEGESRLGVRSALEPDDVAAVTIEGSEATVELAREFSFLAADQQLLAVAQMTCTLTDQPEVESVRFLLDDVVVAVPVTGGQLVERPVGREDYSQLILN